MPKYASVYSRTDSPWWWIAFFDPSCGKRLCQATSFRKSDPRSKRLALNLAFEKSKIAQAGRRLGDDDRWECWVPAFLDDYYPVATQGKSNQRAWGAWKQLRMFLSENDIPAPAAFRYADVKEYVRWRSAQIKPSSGKKVQRNTAISDMQFMSAIMNEARKLGFIEYNPCHRAGLKKDPAAEKREMTDDEIDKIRRELKTRPKWMTTAFEIAIYQGCRLSETAMPWSQIDFERNTVTFVAKGSNGKKHTFTTILHPGLRPFLEETAALARKILSA